MNAASIAADCRQARSARAGVHAAARSGRQRLAFRTERGATVACGLWSGVSHPGVHALPRSALSCGARPHCGTGMMDQGKLPPAVVFLGRHAAIGFGLATLLVAALFWADPGGVAQILRRAPEHPWPTLLLWFFCGLTLGGVQMGIAV